MELFAPVQCCGVGEKCAVLGYKGREGSQSKCGLHSQKDTGTTVQLHRVMSSVARQCSAHVCYFATQSVDVLHCIVVDLSSNSRQCIALHNSEVDRSENSQGCKFFCPPSCENP